MKPATSCPAVGTIQDLRRTPARWEASAGRALRGATWATSAGPELLRWNGKIHRAMMGCHFGPPSHAFHSDTSCTDPNAALPTGSRDRRLVGAPAGHLDLCGRKIEEGGVVPRFAWNPVQREGRRCNTSRCCFEKLWLSLCGQDFRSGPRTWNRSNHRKCRCSLHVLVPCLLWYCWPNHVCQSVPGAGSKGPDAAL